MGSIEPTSGWIFKPLIVEPTEDRFFFLMRSKLGLECCRKRKLKTFLVAKERSPLVFGHVCCFSPRLSTLAQVGWNAGFYFSRSEEELGVKEGVQKRVGRPESAEEVKPDVNTAVIGPTASKNKG